MDLTSKREIFFFYSVPIFLFTLIPLLLISGPFLSDLSISIISLIFLVYCINKKDFSPFKKKYVYFFLAFWLYLLLNSLFNNFNISSLKISFFYFRFGIFVIALVTLIKFNHFFLKYFYYCLLFCFSILILDGFIQYYHGENIIGWEKPDKRLSSFFGDELILGSYLSRLLPLFFALTILFFKVDKKKVFIFVSIFILTEVLVFLSGERAAFFFINLSSFFIIIFSNKLKKIRLISMILSLSIIIVISFFNPEAKKRIIDMTIEQLNINNQENGEVYIFSKQHTHHYISAYRIFLDNKLFGAGVKNFRKLCDKEKYKVSELSCSTHPHNTYVQLLSETGIIGLTFWVVMFLFLCLKIIKHIYFMFRGKVFFTDFEICILSGIIIVIWPFVPTGNIFNNWLNITYFIYLPFMIWSYESRNDNKNSALN